MFFIYLKTLKSTKGLGITMGLDLVRLNNQILPLK